jgi:hypothetical protein
MPKPAAHETAEAFQSIKNTSRIAAWSRLNPENSLSATSATSSEAAGA